MLKVLVVDDSQVVCEFLVHILSSDPELQVIGTASDGDEAVRAAISLKPDVITMDIHMPKMDGFEATRRIMETYPVPIVIVTASSSASEIAGTFRAVEAGALTLVPRPAGIGHPQHETTVKKLIETVKLMSEVKVVRRRASRQRERMDPSILPPVEIKSERIVDEVKCVVIGASTGGPPVLQTILSRLPKEFSFPVLIVQHMAAGFVEGFAEWLTRVSAHPVHMAIDGEHFLPGHIYVAPDGFHMGVGAGKRITLSKEKPENSLRPSVSYLFRSVAQTFGKNSVGVLLSGIGRDGAEELKTMKDKGALTIAQDRESSVVYGMPGEAVKLDAATYVLSPEGIGSVLRGIANKEGVKR
jgi:two-component system chemotaxis response regulator CheB